MTGYEGAEKGWGERDLALDAGRIEVGFLESTGLS